VNDELEKMWKEAVVAFKLLSRYFSEGTDEYHETPQDSRSLGRELNPGPPEYEAGVLTTLPRY
jgi:hypothetical protein